MDEIEAVEKTIAGDEDAFGFLVRRYQKWAYAVALARVYDPQDAQDLVQETFLRAYTRLPMLRDRQRFGPWFFTILRRLSVDFMRGKWRTEQGAYRMESSGNQPISSADPRPEIDAKDTSKTLWALVSQLDENSREVLSLYYGQQMKVTEIAKLTGIRESAVKMRLTKARTVLGDQAAKLQSVWGIAPIPAFSADVMAAVKTAGPIKAGMAAALSPLLGWVAFLAVPGWFLGKDIERWRGHIPASMEKQAKRNIVVSVLICIAAFLIAPLVGWLIAWFLGHDVFHNSWIMVPILILEFILLGKIFWREIELTSQREKIKQCLNAIAVILMFVLMTFNPPQYVVFAYFGGFLAMQYFLFNASGLAQGTVMPGCWVGLLLKRVGDSEHLPMPTESRRLKTWLIMLHELGLVDPPCKTENNGITVRLRLRGGISEKMRCTGYSTLHADESGAVTCSIVPRDYVALAQHFDKDEIPARRELGEQLGKVFTQCLGTYAKEADKAKVAEVLGLGDCPINVTKTYIFMVNKYLLPLAGFLIFVGCVVYHLR